MTCPACGTENEPGGRFCEACGTPLNAACPSCGEAVRADARFCRNCGHRLVTEAAAPAAPAGEPARPSAVAERRVVTVLFVDLVGFTALAEDRDPESTRELLTRYFDVARSAVERHGGTVEKFIGDAVMAVWGTPIAHEDDAERAVRAALELVHEVPSLAPQLAARAGVLSGEVAVTIGATNQGMVAGDLVNTAARLQGVAEPGTVLAGESTMRAAERAIVFEPVGEHSLKGKLTPVPAWRAVRVVAQRGGQQRSDALEPPFVGRDEELRLLKDQLHAPGRDQRARLVSITGPAGIGKSRLVWELQKYMDGITEPVYWHRGRSPSYGEGIAFWALGEMVRRRAGLTEDDDEATTRERIRTAVAEYVADPDERAIVEPALLALLGIGEIGGGGRETLFPAWRLFFERISELGTTALVFEDLHWADAGLLDFIDHLLDWSKSRPILVITLARPELFDRRPDWGVGLRAFTALALEPLPDPAMRQLLEGVVPGLPKPTVDAIVDRAEGVPLYAVETVRTLLADGRIEREGDVFRPVGDLDDVSVPESLRSLIAARLDALEPGDRALVQDAAVLGQVFDAPTLAAISGTSESDLEPKLRSFVRRELIEIETDPRSPERGQYKFVQALIREVAYSTLALRDRRARHLAIARRYEALGEDELAGALASHYLAAHESSAEGPEADAVAAQARIALRAAADRATALGSHAQALAHLEHALEITADERERAELLERAATTSVAGVQGNPEDYARRALAAREAVDDASGVHRGTALVAQILLDVYRIDEATAILTGLLERGGDAPDPEAEAEVHAALSRAYMRGGRHEDAIQAAERALAIAEPRNLVRVVAEAMNNRAAALNSLGRRREARALIEAAVRLADEGGWQSFGLRMRNNLAVVIQDDDPLEAGAVANEMLDIAERIGHVQWYLASASAFAGNLYAEMREWDRALALTSDAAARDVRGSVSWIQALTQRMQLLVARGDEGDIRAEIEAMQPVDLARWWVDSAIADGALWTGDFETTLLRARACLESPWSESNAAYVRAQLVQALVGLGRIDEARGEVQILRDSPFQGALSQALLAAAEAAVVALEDRVPEARAGFTSAFAQLRDLGQRQDLARWLVDAAALLPGTPEATAWLGEARELGERVGAIAFLGYVDRVATGARGRSASHVGRAEEAVPEAS